MNTKAIQATLKLRHEPIEFRDPNLAIGFASRCFKPHYVVLGDCPSFLVVCPADASRLVRAGYELLPVGKF